VGDRLPKNNPLPGFIEKIQILFKIKLVVLPERKYENGKN